MNRPLSEHLDECHECRSHGTTLDEISIALDADTVPIDGSQLSTDAMVWLTAALENNASEALWRRIIGALVLALAPLPLVLAFDAYLLRAFHALLKSIMPGPVATYVTFSYCALLALLLAGTYAAIPITIGRGRRSSFAGGVN